MKSLDEIQAFIDTEFAGLVREHKVPGAAIAVLKDGQIIDAAGGVLSTSTGVEATPDSVFQIGSITKVWTARWSCSSSTRACSTSTLPIRTYLPDFHLADEAAAASITTRQLLSHTAGFEGDIFTDTGRGDDCDREVHRRDRRTAPALPAGRAVLVQQRRLLRPRPARRGAAREAVRRRRCATTSSPRSASPTSPPAPTRRSCSAPPSATSDPAKTASRSRHRSGRSPARTIRPARCSPCARATSRASPRCTSTAARRRTARASSRAESVAAMQTQQVDLPRLDRHGRRLGPRLGDVRQLGAARCSATTAAPSARRRSCASSPRRGWRSRCSPTAATSFGLFEIVVARILASSPGSRCPGIPLPPAEPAAVDATPYLGSTPTPSTTSSSARTRTAGSGSTARRRTSSPRSAASRSAASSSHFGKDTLIPLEAQRGIHPIYAFLGDAGDGKAKYIHYGRVVTRAS